MDLILVNDFLSFIIFSCFVDWEFPVWSVDAEDTDRAGLSRLLRLLRQRFDASSRRLLLTMAVSAPWTITKKGYDVDVVNKLVYIVHRCFIDRYVDYVNIMNYDFHWFSWRTPVTGHNAPLYAKRIEPWPVSTMNSVSNMCSLYIYNDY